jgi:hypothetical protein
VLPLGHPLSLVPSVMWLSDIILIVALLSGRGPLHGMSSTRSYYMLMMGSSHSHVYDGEVVSHTRFPFMRLIQLPL